MARPARDVRQQEFGLAAVPPLVRVRCVGCLVARISGQRRRMGRVADDRQHNDPSAPLRCRRKRGNQFQALGRSRGGFTTKVHLRCNGVGLPIGVVLAAREAHDVTAYAELMEQRDSDPGAMLGDKGYDSDAIRHDLKDRGTAPEIPTRSNRKVQHSVCKPLYAYVRALNASSVISSNSRVWPPDLTRPQAAFSALSCSDASVSGSGLSTEPKSPSVLDCIVCIDHCLAGSELAG
jgi:hypothetical protein